MNAYEEGARFNIAETCVDSVSLNELFTLIGQDRDAFLQAFSARRLTYGAIEGAPAFKNGVCKLYKTISPEHIVPTHGRWRWSAAAPSCGRTWLLGMRG